MFKSLLLAAVMSLSALAPAVAADIAYTVTVTDPGGAGHILLAKATLPEFVTEDTLVWPPELQFCSQLYLRCDSLQFIVDSHAAGLSGAPYTALGLVEHYPDEGGGTGWLYFPLGALSLLGHHHSVFGSAHLTVSLVPEPEMAGLMVLGLGALLLRRRLRHTA